MSYSDDSLNSNSWAECNALYLTGLGFLLIDPTIFLLDIFSCFVNLMEYKMRLRIAFDRLSLLGVSVLLVILSGCASVPMASKELDSAAKTFPPPPADKSGIYVFRNSFLGQGLRKRVSIDGRKVGDTANKVYFYKVIAPGTHTIATESEFGDNSISFQSQAGKNYFARQYITMGAFVGGSNVEMVDEEDGKKEVLQCDLAQSTSSGLQLPARSESPTSSPAQQAKTFEQSSAKPESSLAPVSNGSPVRQKTKEGHFAYEAESSAKLAGCQTQDGSRPAAVPVEIGGGLEVYEVQCLQARLTVRCDLTCQVVR